MEKDYREYEEVDRLFKLEKKRENEGNNGPELGNVIESLEGLINNLNK